MPRRTIVLETEPQEHVQIVRGPTSGGGRRESFYVTFDLPDPVFFDEPHCIRLGGVHQQVVSPALSLFFYTDFTEPQTVNGTYRSYLGTNIPNIRNDYIPLATNELPQIGRLTIETAYRIAVPAREARIPRLVIFLQIVPTRLVDQALIRDGAASAPAI